MIPGALKNDRKSLMGLRCRHVACTIAWCAQVFPQTVLAEPSRRLLPPVVVHLESTEIANFEDHSTPVKALLRSSLDLTHQNIGYLFGSSDPALRGMDCSGTIYYLLRNAGVQSVPRSAEGIYQWVLNEKRFHAVEALGQDEKEFLAMRAGDLLFWSGTYGAPGSNVATHVMIYLGRAKSDGLRLMVGASDGRTYRGRKCYGVSVFDFRLPKAGSKTRFIGFASIPGLHGKPSGLAP